VNCLKTIITKLGLVEMGALHHGRLYTTGQEGHRPTKNLRQQSQESLHWAPGLGLT